MRITLFDKNSNASLLLSGIFLIIVGIGVARFTFTSLLPQMLEHRLTLGFSGLLASINYVGYFAGALVAIFIHSAVYKVHFLRFGMFLCIVTTVVLRLHADNFIWIISSLFAGIGSAMLII
jgi:hypothetical protein